MNRISLRSTRGAALAAALATMLVAPALADTPGTHPYYVHALDDLRHAAALLNHPDETNVVAQQREALADIQTALAAATQAAGDDGKNLSRNFPVDGPQDRRSRLLRARSILADALRDLRRPEQNLAAVALRDQAERATRAAIGETDEAVRADRGDDMRQGPHPAELHALSDLRLARAYLSHGDEGNVVADERGAIAEIDQAIGEAKRAAVDDGKPLDDHPPVDANLHRKDRFHRAYALLQSAARDLGERESDPYARGWIGRARGDIGDALSLVRRALGDDRRDDRGENG